jgi:hypothetical protein
MTDRTYRLSQKTGDNLKRVFDRVLKSPPGRPPEARVTVSPESDGITFQNVGSYAINPHEIMRVDGTVMYGGFPIRSCQTPDAVFPGAWLINGEATIQPGDTGTAQTGLYQFAAYDTGSPAAGDRLGYKSGQGTLTVGGLGGFIVHEIWDSTQKIAVVEFCQLTQILGKPASDIPAFNAGTGLPGSGTVTAFYWNGTDFVTSGLTFTGYNASTTTIKAGSLTLFTEVDGLFTSDSYGGSRVWHVMLGSGVVAGGTVNVTLPDATVVSATNWSGIDYSSGDLVTVYQDGIDGLYYIIKSGSGQTFVVSIYSGTRDGTTSCWAGKVQVPPASPTSFATQQFTNGASCWVVVLNDTWGSGATTPAPLIVGRQYLASSVAAISGVPVYAVRLEDNFIYHITLGSNIAPGATASVTLPTGASVTAKNWSGTLMQSGDKVSVYQDLTDGNWYLIKTGGEGGRRVQALLNGDLYPADASATVDTVTTFDGSAAPVITTATNLLLLAGCDDEVVILEQRIALADWTVAEVQGKVRRRVFASLDADLYSADASASVTAVGTFDNSTAPTITVADNYYRFAGDNGDEVILEEFTNTTPSTWFIVAVQNRFRRRVQAQVNNAAGFFPADTSVTVDTITTYDGQPAPTVTSATNSLKLAGSDNDVLILEEITSASPSTWFVAEVQAKFRRRVQALINNSNGLKTTDSSATVDTVTTFDGSTAPTITTATNPLLLWGLDNFVVILEEITSASPSTWFVANIQQLRVCRRFKAQLSATLHKADATATITSVSSTDGGPSPSPTSANNYLRWAGSSGDPCWIVEDWTSSTVAYILDAVAWDVITPIADSLIDAPNKKLQKKTQDFIGKANAAISSAIDIDTGTSC